MPSSDGAPVVQYINMHMSQHHGTNGAGKKERNTRNGLHLRLLLSRIKYIYETNYLYTPTICALLLVQAHLCSPKLSSSLSALHLSPRGPSLGGRAGLELVDLCGQLGRVGVDRVDGA